MGKKLGQDQSSGQPTGVAALWSTDRLRPGPRPALSAAEIVEAAVRIADESGLDAVSMARVARTLGFSTMALYRHVANKGELLEMMFDAGVGPADQAILDERGWRARMHAYGRSFSRIFRQRPWLMDIPVTAPPVGPNNIGWLELGLTVLSETGLGPRDRMDVYLTLSSYLLGSERITIEVTRAYQAALQSGASTDQITAYGDTLRALLPPGRYPAVEEALAAGVFDGEDGEDTQRGIERILDGVEALIAKRRQEASSGEG
jgi:AcrR family transcriptional regulator